MTPANPIEYGVIGLALIVIYKLVEVGKQMFLNRYAPAPSIELSVPCQADPLWGERMRRIDALTQETSKAIGTGALSCPWKDRDEVRDMLEAIRNLVTATKASSEEMKALRGEMVRNRNGG